MSDTPLLAALEAAVIDMDGVLWRGGTPLPGLTDLFAHLRGAGIPFVLATNNASKSPETYIARLAGHGVEVGRDEILTSSLATAAYLQQTYSTGTPVFVVGGDGLREAMRDAGFDLVVRTSAPAGIVVAGIDFDLTYDKLADAALHIQHGARFVGTNPDRTFPSEAGLLPGAGTILAAITHCTGVQPTIVGKPEPLMFDIAVARLCRPPERTAMIGDRLDTDILGGHRAGLRTILVRSPAHGAPPGEAHDVEPDLAFEGLPELTAAWRAARA